MSQPRDPQQHDPPAGAPGRGARRRPAAWWARDRFLLVAALLLRWGLTALVFHGRGARGGLELGTLADHIAGGDGFVWHFYGSEVPRWSFFPPFYPYLLALLKLTAGGHWLLILQGVQGLIGALLPLVVRRLGARLMRAELAVLAAWITVLWPPFIAYGAEVFPVTVHTVGVPALLLMWVGVAQRARPDGRRGGGRPVGGWRAGLGVGAAHGLLAYSLPSFLGALVVMPLGLRLGGLGWRRAAGLPLVALVTALLVLAPWTVRNAVVQHRFVPVATNLGFNLAGANNPFSRPYSNVLCAYDAIRWQVIDRTALESMNEADFDRRLVRQALAYMAQYPRQTLGRMGTRVLYYWWISPAMLRYNRLQGLVGMLLMSLLAPLALGGAVLAWRARRRTPWPVLLAACLWLTLFYMHFAVRGRYSLAAQPLMILFAALALGALGGWRRRRAPPPLSD